MRQELWECYTQLVVKVLLLLTVFLIPLIPASNNFGYEQIKVFFLIVSLTIVGLSVRMTWTPIQKAATLFVVILFITSALGVNIWNSFLGTQVYFQGWILYAYLYLFFLLVSWSKIKIENWAYILVGSSTMAAIVAIRQWLELNIFHQIIPTYAGRVVSTFGQPNFYSGYILMCLPFFYYLIIKKANWWLILGFLISILAIVISGSRTAYAGVTILLLYWLIKQLRVKKLFILISLVILVVALASSFYLSSGILWSEWKQPQNNQWLIDNSPEKRIFIYPVMIELIKKSPILGYGLENMPAVFSQYFIDNKHSLFEETLNIKPEYLSLKDLNLDRSHNYVLDLIFFSGILGLISWIILVVMLFKKLFQNVSDPTSSRLCWTSRKQNVLIISLITYLVWIQFQNQSVVHLVYFWLLVGLIDGDSKNLGTVRNT